MIPRVAVIIPFYQVQKGLLQKAISSIVAQVDSEAEFIVIVVDDSSPVSAMQEIDALKLDKEVEIILDRQENGGPGSARNRGIEIALQHRATFVAFIDSDDVWDPLHIQSALRCMSREGSDWYFSDILNDGVSSLGGWPRAKKFLNSCAAKGMDCVNLKREIAVEIIAAECWPHISASVFDSSILSHVRFDTRFRRACEDQLFFLNAALASKMVTMSNSVAGERGAGISIYRETMAWSSSNGPARMIEELAYRSMIFRDLRIPIRSKIKLMWSGVAKLTHLWFVIFWNLRHGKNMVSEALNDLRVKAPVFLFISPISLLMVPFYFFVMKLKSWSLMKGGA
ncbi:hypothetical protein GCM10009424_21320 [Sphingomonas ursincola]